MPQPPICYKHQVCSLGILNLQGDCHQRKSTSRLFWGIISGSQVLADIQTRLASTVRTSTSSLPDPTATTRHLTPRQTFQFHSSARRPTSAARPSPSPRRVCTSPLTSSLVHMIHLSAVSLPSLRPRPTVTLPLLPARRLTRHATSSTHTLFTKTSTLRELTAPCTRPPSMLHTLPRLVSTAATTSTVLRLLGLTH